jgi:16S rRNA G1207 methylase RsmC
MTLTITHTAVDGTLLEGTSKGDGAWEAIKAAQAAYRIRGWKYFPSIRAIGVSHSRDKPPKLGLIDATADVLRAAGFTVDIVIDGAPRAMEQAEADRAERMEDRADALAAKATRKGEEAEARYAAAQQIGDGIPMGQPVLVGHHSERGHRRDLKRMDTHMRKSVEAEREAQSAAERAETAARHMEARNNPRRVYRRIRTLEADQRKAERELTPCPMSGRKFKPEAEGRTLTCPRCYHDQTVGADLLIPEHGCATGRRREEVELRVAHLTEQIRYWREALDAAKAAGADVPPDTDAIQKGCWVRSWAGWCEVKRVNKVTVTVLRSYDNYADKQPRMFDQKITLDDIREIRETSPFEPDPAVDLDAELAALDAADAEKFEERVAAVAAAEQSTAKDDDPLPEATLTALRERLGHVQSIVDRPIPEWQKGGDREVTERIKQGAGQEADVLRAEIATLTPAPARHPSGLSAAAVDVLSRAAATERSVHLPVGPPLERSLYAEVDKALTRLAGGGRWDRRERAHLYNRDPRPDLARLRGGGAIPRPASAFDDKRLAYYPTPQAVAEKMVAELDLPRHARVLEPSAGDGALVRAVRAAHPEAYVEAVEVDLDRMRILGRMQGEFMQAWCARFQDYVTNARERGMLYPFHAVVMNPPFTEVGDPNAWATHFLLAWDLLAADGQMVAILPASYLYSTRRVAAQVRELVESSDGAVDALPEGTFKGDGTGVHTVMVSARKDGDT